jgi:hypothetical protein
MSGGKWVGSDSDKGFKPRSEKVGEHREVASFAKVVRCCFNKESDCPARLRIIRHAEAAAEGRAGTYDLERYGLLHSNHDKSNRSRVRTSPTLSTSP